MYVSCVQAVLRWYAAFCAGSKGDRGRCLLTACIAGGTGHKVLQSSPAASLSDLCRPPDSPDGALYMTAISKCANDSFYVSFVTFGADQKPPQNVTWASGADATAIEGAVQHEWRGYYILDQNITRIVVLRASDGKLIQPKGVMLDGTFYDVSSTEKPACQLFQGGSTPLEFAIFRAKLSEDGSRVLRNDFGSPINSARFPGGVPCEQYRDAGGANFGKVADTYLPGSCLYGIDDCST